MSITRFMSRDERVYFDDGCRHIIRHYGDTNQAEQLGEECSEFCRALCRIHMRDTPENRENLAEEFADLCVVMAQILGAADEEPGRHLAEIALRKVARQLDRIDAEVNHG